MKPIGAGWQLARGFLLVAALAGCQPDSRPAETNAATVAPAAADSLAVSDALAKAPELGKHWIPPGPPPN